MNDWLQSHLVCPRDKRALELSEDKLTCPENHVYPVFDGIPIMLVDDVEVTHHYINRTLEKVSAWQSVAAEKQLSGNEFKEGAVDEFVQAEIPLTSGHLYLPAQHKLTRYPIPNLRLPEGSGERLLDIGCNWGRWTIAAAQKGYQPVGIDPSLDSILAARRVAKQLGVKADYIVGDARFLPFADDAFDVAYCYSVLQHFSKENVRICLDEISRVTRKNGRTLIQMPNRYGIRQYQQHRRRGFTEGEGFDVRYWIPSELMETFERKIGKTKMTTDCFFGLGIQASDVDLLPWHYKMVVYSSEALRKMSLYFKPLVKVADSVYLESTNQKNNF